MIFTTRVNSYIGTTIVVPDDFSDAISVGDGDLGRTGLLRHKINVGDAPPIRQQARRLPFHQRDMAQKMIAQHAGPRHNRAF